MPKSKKTFCKGCKKHSAHKVTQYKTGKASLYAQGTLMFDGRFAREKPYGSHGLTSSDDDGETIARRRDGERMKENLNHGVHED